VLGGFQKTQAKPDDFSSFWKNSRNILDYRLQHFGTFAQHRLLKHPGVLQQSMVGGGRGELGSDVHATWLF